jgi:hypothetical protein
MESRTKTKPVSPTGIAVILIAAILSLSATSALADSYRWKDKEGKIHYGASVPAEYADQPYDILNNAGMVIEHVEDTTVPLEVITEKKIQKERAPLISEEQRQIQSDKLLVFRYSSEEEIVKAMELEIAQLGYDMKTVAKSYSDTNAAIRMQISKAANQQRSGQKVTPELQKEIDRLYNVQAQDGVRRSSLEKREERVRARYGAELERYRFLTSDAEETEQEPTDPG